MPNIRMILLAALLTLVGLASVGNAIPPPLKPEELEQRSDFIGTVKVLAVTCTSIAKDPRTGEDLPNYQAWLQVVETKKGKAMPGDTLVVSWRAISKKLVGAWSVSYAAGETVSTHLQWVEGGRSYTTTWWNAKGKPISEGNATLPTKVGEIILGK
jgi:hypothetical protein